MKPSLLRIIAFAAFLATAATRVQAAFLFTVFQDGADVIATGSGTINPAALTLYSQVVSTFPNITPASGVLYSGPLSTPLTLYTGTSGPVSFGSGGLRVASSGAGDIVGIAGGSTYLLIPQGYVSGSALSDTATFDNTTLSALGATPGVYTYTWGSGANADTLTVDIVPEPSTWALLGLGASLLGLTLHRRAAGV